MSHPPESHPDNAPESQPDAYTDLGDLARHPAPDAVPVTPIDAHGKPKRKKGKRGKSSSLTGSWVGKVLVLVIGVVVLMLVALVALVPQDAEINDSVISMTVAAEVNATVGANLTAISAPELSQAAIATRQAAEQPLTTVMDSPFAHVNTVEGQWGSTLSWSPENNRIATGDLIGERAFIHNIYDGRGESFNIPEGYVDQVEWSPTAPILAVSNRINQPLMLFDRTFSVADDGRALPGSGDLLTVSDVAWSPDGRFLALAGGDEVGVWLMPSGEQIALLEMPTYGARLLAWSPDGTRLAVATLSNLYSLNWADGALSLEAEAIGLGEHFHALDISPDGARVVAADYDTGLLWLWDVESGETRFIEAHGDGARTLDWHPTRAWIVSGGGDGRTQVWDADSRERVALLPPLDDSPVQAVVWSHDGNLLGVLGGGDVTIYRLLAD